MRILLGTIFLTFLIPFLYGKNYWPFSGFHMFSNKKLPDPYYIYVFCKPSSKDKTYSSLYTSYDSLRFIQENINNATKLSELIEKEYPSIHNKDIKICRAELKMSSDENKVIINEI